MDGLFNHIHHALSQVRELRQRVLENQLFRGYSGIARAIGGVIALLGAAIMALPIYPETTLAHVIGWGMVCALAVMINYGALALWYLDLKPEKKKLSTLKPALDAVPPLVVGGVLTFAILINGIPSLLFGTWMCLYGLVNIVSRHFLPKTVAHLGCYYVICGASYLLFWSDHPFTNPWPMAIVFFFGESIGSFIFHKNRLGDPTVAFDQDREEGG